MRRARTITLWTGHAFAVICLLTLSVLPSESTRGSPFWATVSVGTFILAIGCYVGQFALLLADEYRARPNKPGRRKRDTIAPDD